MDIDKTTYNDLSIFNHEEEYSVFHHINFTTSVGGKEWLRYMLSEPHSDIQKILSTQQIIRIIKSRLREWPTSISNGTLMVLERFYDTALDRIPASNDYFNTWLYKVIHSVDYGLIRYSIAHFRDFILGMHQISVVFDDASAPARLELLTSRIRTLLQHHQLQELLEKSKGKTFSTRENLYFGFFFREGFKEKIYELMDMYCQFDAWYSMAMAVEKHQLSFPEFVDSSEPFIKAKGLYHILLSEPVSYDVELSPSCNFLFLTLVMAISASGNSPNVVCAVEYANSLGCQTLALTGLDGGRLARAAKFNIHVSVRHMGRVEDAHMIVCHMISYYFIDAEGASGRKE